MEKYTGTYQRRQVDIMFIRTRYTFDDSGKCYFIVDLITVCTVILSKLIFKRFNIIKWYNEEFI